jgi:hypothetical protein
MGITTEKIKEMAGKSTGIGLKSILTRTGLLNVSIGFPVSGERSQISLECKV